MWSRRPFAIHGISIDPNSSQVTLTLKDQRPIMCLVRDPAWSDKASGNLLDGIARFATPGATFTFRGLLSTRSRIRLASPRLPTDVPAYGDGGLCSLLVAARCVQATTSRTIHPPGRGTLRKGRSSVKVNLAAVSVQLIKRWRIAITTPQTTRGLLGWRERSVGV